MQLAKKDVVKVANLSKLSFNDAELDDFTLKLGSIVSFVEQLNELDTSGIEPLAHPNGVESVLRVDANRSSLPREAAVNNAPNSDGEFFLVPAVMKQ